MQENFPTSLGRHARIWAFVMAIVLLSAASVAQAPENRLKVVDQILNETFNRVIRAAPAPAAAALRESERRWIVFRDANAALAACMRRNDVQAAVAQQVADTARRTEFLKGSFGTSATTKGDRDDNAMNEADQRLKGELAAVHSLLDTEGCKVLEASQGAWDAVRESDIVALSAAGVVRNDGAKWAVRRARADGRSAFLRSLRAEYAKDSRNDVPPLLRPAVRANPSIKSSSASIGDLRMKPMRKITDRPHAGSTVSDPMQVVTRIDAPKHCHAIGLDMRDKLLIRTDGGSIDFWDVQTGGLIRTLHPSLSATSITSLGGGLAAVQSSGRRAVDIEIFDRVTAHRRDQVSLNYFDGYGWDRRSISVAKDVGLIALLGGTHEGMRNLPDRTQSLWLGDRAGPLREFEPPLLGVGEAWEFVAVAKDAGCIALASEARVALFALPDGKMTEQFALPGGARVAALVPDPHGGFLVYDASGQLFRRDAMNGQLDLVCELPLDLTPPKNGAFMERVALVAAQAGWSFASFGSQIAFSQNTPEIARRLIAGWFGTRPFTVDSEGEYAAVSGEGSNVELFHLASGQLVRTFGTAIPKVRAVLSGDGQRIVNFALTKAGLLRITLLEAATASSKSFEVRGFEEILAVDASGKRAVLGTRIPPTEEVKSAHFIVGYGRVKGTIGILDLETGLVTNRTLPPDTDRWQFSEGNALLCGSSSKDVPLQSLTILDIFGKQGATESRSIRLPTLPNGIAKANALRSISRDASKLAFRENENLHVVAVGKDGFASGRGWKMDRDDTDFQDAAFSKDGNLLVCFVEKEKWGGGEVRLVDTRTPDRIQWSVAHDIRAGFSAFTTDNRCILIGGEDGSTFDTAGYNLELLDAGSGRKRSSIRVLGSLASVAADGSRVLLEAVGGGYQIVEVRDDQLVATLRYVPGIDANFAFLLPDGHYLSTADAHRRISFAKGGRSETAESLDIKLNRPDLVVKELGGNPEMMQAFRRAYEKRLARMGIDEKDLADSALPPVMSIDYSKVPLTTAKRVLQLSLDAKPGGSPLTALEITVNDVPALGRYGRSLQGAEKNGFARDVEVELASGSNKVTCWVRDARGMTSSRLSINVTLTDPPPKPPTLYVLALGIDDYPGEKDDLKLARKDANDIAAVFEKNARPAFAEVKTRVIPQDKATRRGVLSESSFFAEAGVDDQVVLFIAGHGLVHDYEYRFCTADFQRERIGETTITYAEIEGLLDGCRARKRIVLLDTCQSGEPNSDERSETRIASASNKGDRGITVQPIDARKVVPDAGRIADLLGQYFVDLRIGVGAAVLASSTAEQNSGESTELQNGIFTAAVIRGLQERKADFDQDGVVRVSELLRYCKVEVARLSKGTQDPVARHVNLSEDFAVATFR